VPATALLLEALRAHVQAPSHSLRRAVFGPGDEEKMELVVNQGEIELALAASAALP